MFTTVLEVTDGKLFKYMNTVWLKVRVESDKNGNVLRVIARQIATLPDGQDEWVFSFGEEEPWNYRARVDRVKFNLFKLS